MFETLFECSPDACLLIENNRFIKCNQAAVDMLRADSKEQVFNTHPSEISPEFQPDGRSSYEKAEELLAKIIDTGSLHFEWIHKRMNGEEFPVDVSLTLIRDGERTIIYTVWRDISVRKIAEESLLREKKFSTEAVNSLPGVFYIISPTYNFLQWNDNFERLTEYSFEELGQISPLELFGGTDKERIKERIQEVFAKGSANVEAELVSKSGKHIPHHFTGRAIQIDGQTCLIGMGIDITERKLAEEALLELKDKLQEQNEELLQNEEELRTQNNELLATEEMLRVQINDYEVSQKLLKEVRHRV